ncbi:MAG: hypothetical protein B7Z16_11630, partial [Algoriphagus sp. 32-45-6]
YGSYSLISSNDSLFEQLPADYSFIDSLSYKIGNKTYIIASRELMTYAHKPLAKMIYALDITDDELAYEKEIRNVLLISLLLLSLLWIILHIGFKALINRIRTLSSQITQQLDDQLHMDSLTALPNRKALLENIQQKKHIAILLLNINNFKEINDFYGHEVGDQVLLSITNTIKDEIQKYPMRLYKMPSDEYAIALLKPMSGHECETISQAILNDIQTTDYLFSGIHIQTKRLPQN